MPDFDYDNNNNNNIILRTNYVSTLNDSIEYNIIMIGVRYKTPRATEMHLRARVVRITHYYGSVRCIGFVCIIHKS